MDQMKRYELKRRMYLPIKNGPLRSYGGRQQWFSKEVAGIKDLKSYFTHTNGCGVIALCDLFFYLALTYPGGKKTAAGQKLDAYGNITKEQYMDFVGDIRDQYAMIYGGCGTFGWEIAHAVNEYCKDNEIGIKAKFESGLSELKLLKKIQDMLIRNCPVILMIGQSHPVPLSKIKKAGIPFFKQKQTGYKGISHQNQTYATYEIAEKAVYGHFVMITGIIVDNQAQWASQRIMLRISSWGEEYYISYDHYCQFMKRISRPWLCGIISLEEIKSSNG